MSDTTINTTDIPTQIEFSARAILRTAVQALVAALVTFAASYGINLTGISTPLVEVLTSLVWILLTALVAYVMTRPAVARILAGTILAPKPSDIPGVVVAPIVPSVTANADGTVTSVAADGTQTVV